jgi:hypothetical protein
VLDVEYFKLEQTRGRPRKILSDYGAETVTKLSSIMCTDEEIASFLEVTVDTLNSKWNRERFQAAKESGQNKGRASLRRAQFKAAEKGNSSMLIWLGKQYLGQKDEQITTLQDANITFDVVGASKE